MKTATVKIKSAFFLTDEGAAALTAYNAWNKPEGDTDSDEVKQRKQALVDAGLLKVSKPIEGGNGPRIKAALKGVKGGLTIKELAAKINETLEEEDKGEKVTEKSITTTVSFQGLKNGRSGDSYYLTKGEDGKFLLRTGK